MANIIPAIIPETIYDLKEKIEKVVGEVPVVQIDVLDGKLTSKPSWPYKKKDDLYFDQILGEEEGLPFWEEVDFEIDMMVADPAEEARTWIAAGAARLIIHSSSKDAIAAIKDLRLEFPRDDMVGIGIGLALDPETSLDVVKEVAEDVDVVQIMGINRIGFQGEAFNDETLAKVKELRALYPEISISVDGGVNLQNAEALLAAGADTLIVGSAIFNESNVHDALREFTELE